MKFALLATAVAACGSDQECDIAGECCGLASEAGITWAAGTSDEDQTTLMNSDFFKNTPRGCAPTDKVFTFGDADQHSTTLECIGDSGSSVVDDDEPTNTDDEDTKKESEDTDAGDDDEATGDDEKEGDDADACADIEDEDEAALCVKWTGKDCADEELTDEEKTECEEAQAGAKALAAGAMAIAALAALM